jgi:hypothetical protein
MWGFWDRDAGTKQRQNWRRFVMTYQRLKPFDHAIIQMAKTGDLHAFGVIKGSYFDDQTPVWPEEIRQGKVLFPWKVSFSLILFSEGAIMKRFIKGGDYIDGYGLGEARPQDTGDLIAAIENRTSLKIKGEI